MTVSFQTTPVKNSPVAPSKRTEWNTSNWPPIRNISKSCATELFVSLGMNVERKRRYLKHLQVGEIYRRSFQEMTGPRNVIINPIPISSEPSTDVEHTTVDRSTTSVGRGGKCVYGLQVHRSRSMDNSVPYVGRAFGARLSSI